MSGRLKTVDSICRWRLKLRTSNPSYWCCNFIYWNKLDTLDCSPRTMWLTLKSEEVKWIMTPKSTRYMDVDGFKHRGSIFNTKWIDQLARRMPNRGSMLVIMDGICLRRKRSICRLCAILADAAHCTWTHKKPDGLHRKRTSETHTAHHKTFEMIMKI